MSELDDKVHVERLCADLRELQAELEQVKAERYRLREAVSSAIGHIDANRYAAAYNELLAAALGERGVGLDKLRKAAGDVINTWAALSEKGSK